MPSIAIDRLDGLSSATAMKGPCRVATTGNITLSGEQTIDGVAVVDGDRVLVKDQTDARENGIYVADTGNWARAKDFSRNRDVQKGTRVVVTDGTAGAGDYSVSTGNPIQIGTSSIAFVQAIGSVPAQVRDLLDTAPYVATRSALKALDTTKDTVAILTEPGREGTFVWRSGDYSTQITADTAEGIYVKADAVASTGGAWVRQFDSALEIGWFGDAATAIAYAAVNAKALHVTGSWTLSAQLSLTSPLTLFGDGRDKSELRFSSANGFLVTLTNQQHINDIRHLKITTSNTSGGGIGFDIARDVPVSGIRQPQDTFLGVDFGGSTLNDGYFDKCIRLTNSRSPRILHCNFFGKYNNPTIGTYGVELAGQTINPKILDCQCAGYDTFVYSTGSSEGIQIDHCQTSLCHTGVYLDGTGSNPQVNITDNHFNTDTRGIYVEGYLQGFISNNLFYSSGQGGGFASPSEYIGVEFSRASGGGYTSIIGNTVNGLQTITETGFRVSGGGSNVILALNYAVSVNGVGFDIGTTGSVEAWGNSAPGTTTPWTGGGTTGVRMERIPSSGDLGFFDGASEIFRIKEDGSALPSNPRGTMANMGSWYVLAKSAVAVSHTGDTNETTLATVTIPAGAMGANGVLRITALWSGTSNANNKTYVIRLGGTSGSIIRQTTQTTNSTIEDQVQIANRNSASSQVEFPYNSSVTGFGVSSGAVTTFTVNTASAQDLLFRGTLANAADTVTLEAYTVELLYGA